MTRSNNAGLHAMLARGALLAAAAVSCAWLVAVFLAVSLRVAYPYELEWMEGATLDHLWRLRDGLPLYPAPTLDFVPFRYPPLFYYLGAVVSPLVGWGFAALRFVSILSMIACMAAMGWLAWRDTRSWQAALVAPGFYAATYASTGGWFDVGRPDSLFLALALACIVLMRDGRRGWHFALAGALAALSFFAKQTAVSMLAPFAVYAVVCRRRHLAAMCAGFVAVFAASFGVMLAAHGRWIWFYVIEMAGAHSYRLAMFLNYWTHDLGPSFAPALAAAVWTLARFQWLAMRDQFVFYCCLLVSALFGTCLVRSQAGAYLNILMPAFAGIGVVFAVGLGLLVQCA